MADFPVLEVARVEQRGSSAGNSYGTSITASASTNTKGSASNIGAVTSFDAAGFFVNVRGSTITANYLIDVMADSQVVLSNVLLSVGGATGTCPLGFYVPIAIPAGSQLSAAVQSDVTSAVAIIQIYPVAAGFPGFPAFRRAITYGAETADSTGIQVDPGSVANTKPASWTTIAASVTADIRWIIVIAQGQTALLAASIRLDLAIGGAGSEQTVLPDLLFRGEPNVDQPLPLVYSLPLSIPAGARLAARAQSNVTTGGTREIDVQVIGIG